MCCGGCAVRPHRTDGSRPAGHDPVQARTLADHLLGPTRRLPAVVITAGSGDGDGLISAQNVADDVGELAEVWWMRTGDPTWEFTDAMPDLTQVFGDAARVYALDGEWQTNPFASKLYMCGTAARAEHIEDDLVADAMEAAGRAGLLQQKVATSRIVEGQVYGFPAPGRAWIKGPFGLATVRSELVPGRVPVERLLTPGMTVQGRLDENDMLIDIGDMVRSSAEALADYNVGDDVLVRVKTVGSSVVAVEMYPETIVEMRVGEVTGNDRDDLRDLMSEGEVLVATVQRTGSWILTMKDVEDDAEPRAASLLNGGPPWLEEPVEPDPEIPRRTTPRVVAAAPASPVDTPAVSSPTPPPRPVPDHTEGS